MFLQLFDTLTLREVGERFNECFPNLRLAFYSKAHRRFEASDKADQYPEGCLLGDIRKTHNNEPYEIKSWFTTSRVERELKEKYGLNAQILRWDSKNGIWIQTTLSDNLTLQQQSQFAFEPLPTNANESV